MIIIFTIFITNNYYVFSDNKTDVLDNMRIAGREFADDSVIVVFKEKYSDYNRIFSKTDFPEIQCNSIKDLNYHAREKIAEKKEAKKSELNTVDFDIKQKNTYTDAEIIKEFDINVKNYKNVVSVKLKNKGEQYVLNAINVLESRSDVEAVFPNYIYHANSTPNDYYYNLDTEHLKYQWAINAIQLPEAWEHTKGSNQITVGIIDSGIDYDHPDLIGKVDTQLSKSFLSGKSALDDENIHGTHVAGIIGANTNNSIGIAGVCWNVKLVSLKVLDENGNGTFEDTAEAINYAKTNNFDIINCSFSNGYNVEQYNEICNFEGLIVASAGNDAANNDGSNPKYPASYPRDNIISVMASDEDGEIRYDSNYGAATVDLGAPGNGIMSTVPVDVESSGYSSGGGTSMAAPYVTGVAALMMSANPALKDDPVAVKNIILSTVDKNSNFTGKCVSGGTLNAYKAVLGAVNHYTYSSVATHGGRFFYTDDTDWFGLSCRDRVFPGDINGDGRTDLIGINYDREICYTANNGRGTYHNQAKLDWNGFAPSWFWNTYNQRLWVADVNADGYDDFIGVSIDGYIYTSINNGNCTFTTPTNKGGTAFRSESGWFSTSARERVWPGDINGDGRADLMGISGNGNVYYSLANSSGGYSSEAHINVTNGFAESWFSNNYNQRIWVADVNGDGYDDFIGVSIDGHIYTSINNGNFTFTTPTNKGGIAFRSESAWFSTAHSGRVWPADVNGDGRCDLIGISGDGNVYTCMANSNGTYGSECRNLVVNDNGFNENWFNNNEKQRLWLGIVDRYSRPDFIGVTGNGYAYVSLQLCSAPH